MLAIIDYRMDDFMVKSLDEIGFKIIKLPSFSKLQKPVSSHPDMLIFFLSNNLITSEEYYSVAKSEIDEIVSYGKFNLIKDDIKISTDYPKDIAFNAFTAGDYLIGNLEYLSKKLKSEAKELGFKLINVNQGYAKCSVLKVSENAFLTADEGIYKALSKIPELDVLKISEGSIQLDGYGCGFIGGATGSDDNNVYICGDIKTHPEYEAVLKFCRKHKKKIINLKEKAPIYDYGTIFFVKKARR